MASISRNAPCPCGSGRKYKHCHGKASVAPRANAAASRWHVVDNRLAEKMAAFARLRLGARMDEEAGRYADVEATLPFFIHLVLYHTPVDGQPVAAQYLAEHGQRLDANEREWLGAQLTAWLSIWEVESVHRGVGATMVDLLSDERREVHEVAASEIFGVRDAILGRVTDIDGVSLLTGVYPTSLPPGDAARVVARVQKRLRRTGLVPIERLRNEKTVRFLADAWEEAVDEAWARSRAMPELRNSDGDSLVLISDHFAFDKRDREKVVALLATIPGLEPPQRGDAEEVYTFLRPDHVMSETSFTILGALRFTRRGLVVESNSERRANAHREVLIRAGAGVLRYVTRELSDPLSAPAREAARGAPLRPPEQLPPEALEAVQRMMDEYYRKWLDDAIPALGGATPREAAKTREGRAAVEVLLKEMEHHAGAGGGAGAGGPMALAGPDVAALRRELGIGKG